MYAFTRLIHALPLEERRVFSSAEAASYLCVSKSHFKNLVAKGQLPRPLSFGRARRWDKAALDRHLDELRGLESEAKTTSKRSAYDDWTATRGQS